MSATLFRTLTEAIPRERRRDAITALLNAEQIANGRWLGIPDGGGPGYYGCCMVTAAFGILHQPIDPWEIAARYTGLYDQSQIEAYLAPILGIAPAQVHNCWVEWDRMTESQREELLTVLYHLRDSIDAPEDEIVDPDVAPAREPEGVLCAA